MQKDSQDLKLEKKYLSNNNYWKDVRRRRVVFIPKKLGAVNPKRIKTDSFDFAKIGDAITKTAATINKVAKPVQEVATTIKNLATTVKETSTVLKQPATTKQLPPSQNYINDWNYQNQPETRTAGGPIENVNGQIRIFGSNIPMPFVLLTVAVIVYGFYKLVLKK